MIPPRRKPLRQLFAPSDATETERQGQGIGDIEAMRQMAGMVGKEVVSNLPLIEQGVAAKDFGEAAVGGDKLGMGLAVLSALPMGKLVGKVAKNIAPAAREAAEVARVANRDKYFPDKVFHSTLSPTGIKEFKAKLGSGTAWHDLEGAHVGTLDAATQRAETYSGPNFEATPYVSNKTGVEDPTRSRTAASILPLRMRTEKPFLNPKGEPFTEKELGSVAEKWAIDNGYFSTTLPKGDPLYGASHSARKEAARKDFSQYLRSEGYDVIPYVNDVEDKGSLSYLVLNPTRLRSEFAKFDPKKLNSANLSAGLGSLFVGGAMAKAATRDQKNDQ